MPASLRQGRLVRVEQIKYLKSDLEFLDAGKREKDLQPAFGEQLLHSDDSDQKNLNHV